MATVEPNPRGRVAAVFRFTGMPTLSRSARVAVDQAAKVLEALTPVERQAALLTLCDRFPRDDEDIDRYAPAPGPLPRGR